MTKLVLKTAPATEPVSLLDVKSQLRMDSSDSDMLLSPLILAARTHVENLCGPLITQTWEQYEQVWPTGNALLIGKPRLQTGAPVSPIITYTDSAGVAATFASSNYSVDTKSEYYPRIVLNDGKTWPGVVLHPNNPIKIELVCGYGGTSASVPVPLQQAIILYAESLFTGNPVSDAFDALINNYRIWS